MGVLKPARTEAQDNSKEEILCDLDLIATRKATFILHGKTHVLLPITTEAFLKFWQKVADFKEVDSTNLSVVDQAYLETIQVLCKTIKIDDVKKMSIMQRSVLIESLAGKVVGDTTLLKRVQAESEKKKAMTLSSEPLSASLN